MTTRLPILLLLCILTVGGVLGSVGAQQAELAPADDPAELMVRAVHALEKCQSISAQIVHEVHLYDKHLVGSGVYLGQWRDQDYLMRLELKIQLDQETSSLVQVCDGQFLWTRQNMPHDDKLTRIDVARAKAGLEKARKAAGPQDTKILPGIGGLPRVIRGIHESFDFDTVTLGSWGEQKQPVWRIQGRWKPQVLAKMFPGKKAAILAGEIQDLGSLSPHLPDRVVVYLLAQENPLPFRVEYWRTTPESGSNGRALVTMELGNIQINLPIADERFIYNPGNRGAADVTGQFLQSLGDGPK